MTTHVKFAGLAHTVHQGPRNASPALTVRRLQVMGVTPFQIAGVFRGILARIVMPALRASTSLWLGELRAATAPVVNIQTTVVQCCATFATRMRIRQLEVTNLRIASATGGMKDQTVRFVTPVHRGSIKVVLGMEIVYCVSLANSGLIRPHPRVLCVRRAPRRPKGVIPSRHAVARRVILLTM